MRSLFLLTLFLFYTATLFAQLKQVNEESFEYRTNGALKFYNYGLIKTGNGLRDTLYDGFKFSTTSFRFQKANVIKHPIGGYNVVLLKFPTIVNDTVITCVGKGSSRVCHTKVLTNNDTVINGADNDKIFWMKEEEFNDHLQKEFIIRRYSLKPTFGYGATLSLPFKMRPKTKDQHMKITPEFTLGGYFGPRFRMNRYKAAFVTFPVTLGVSAIGINDNNTIKESGTAQQEGEDGLVLGRTISIGSVVEYSGFQMGFIMGWDKASGEIGSNCIYNDRPWYSFSIGFTFFNRTTGTQK